MPFMKAYEPRSRPAPLTGPIMRRADARIAYNRIVKELGDITDRDTLEIYLLTVGEELIQFENELPFYWDGDGEDFLGIDREIKRAWRRVTAEW